MSSTIALSSEESCTGSEVEALAELALYSVDWDADGGGTEGGPCVLPPSANATADIETTRRQVAKSRLSFVIFAFSFSRNSRCTEHRGDRQMLLSARIIALLAILGARRTDLTCRISLSEERSLWRQRL